METITLLTEAALAGAKCKAYVYMLLNIILLGLSHIQDFEFADSENGVNIVKRATGYIYDDEDFQDDDAGSAPDTGYTEYEGSGTTAVTTTTRRFDVVDYPRFFRVSVSFSNLPYTTNIFNRESQEFKEQSELIAAEIENLFWNIEGRKTVTVLQYSTGDQGQILVTFDLGYEGSEPDEELSQVLEAAVSGGRIGRYAVSSDGFSVRSLEATSTKCRLDELLCAQNQVCIPRLKACDRNSDCPGGEDEHFCREVQCPIFVGRSPEVLPRNGTNYASLLINNAFPCDGAVVAWEYYRVIPQGIAFVGIWRQLGDSEFVLLSKKYVQLETPILVQRGDFIGVFYPETTPNNVIAQATPADDVVAPTELYQTYLAQMYEHEVQEGIPFDINTIRYVQTNSTFALRALMNYDVEGIESNPCKSNEFSCGNGYCVLAEYQCDGQNDCENGADELNCVRCSEDEFTCKSGECIAQFLRCNQVKDCSDGSDETACPVSCKEDEQFTCQNGECIPIGRLCDAQPDCSDNSDEDRELCLPTIPTFPPVCPEGFFRCALGICVEMTKRCDRVSDCPDATDEVECEGRRCDEREFRCDSGACIDSGLQCDGVSDCDDHSDEIRCVTTCSSAEFTCKSGQCIDLRRRCDTYPDCVDQSDEIGCPCRPEQFVCGDGQCISELLRCDRSYDCRDGSDERDCPRCRRNEFECNDGTCIDRRNKCDRSVQCPDSSDEFNCTCNAVEFRCGNGQCIPQQTFCDQRQDCVDGTDESNCPQVCREDQFACASGECIDRRRTCDGRADCRDRSDEQNCPIPPSFQCMPGQYRCATGQCIDAGFKCDRQIDCLDRSDETRCLRRCPETQFQCDSGHCLDVRRRCDGRRDCPNGSDEVGCPTCSPADFTCGNSQCIPITQRCDRRSDCSDGSDERGCPCATGEFTCVSDGRCLPPGYRCNGNPDCRDGSDEQDCERCREDQFQCGTGECIDSRMVCDSISDCPDSSDEEVC
ncbi:unnamed protein product, partial [Candidula unifasciata]